MTKQSNCLELFELAEIVKNQFGVTIRVAIHESGSIRRMIGEDKPELVEKVDYFISGFLAGRYNMINKIIHLG